MKSLLSTAAVLVSLAAPAFAETSSATYAQIDSEIGCKGSATDIKKDLIFNTKYRGRTVTWTGKVHDVKNGKLWLQTPGSRSIGSDFDVEMDSSVDLMQFDKGQTVTVQFEIKDYMGCFMPLFGKNGTLAAK
ncbi:hypothetical protein GWG65_34905 [Bradyrhizobium sp. CSA207]|uniref:hypothetical protein n=1 Tax=Bradyrhizobium sp. CSA207 TaxID=2698826 RepID=UPI0023B1271D|nr:hypothetical protein [Bradyrhizobium sp. CSA207]MDE5446463.1 hypothetical protein [Bradyrhizobium sp. CSA207]